MRAALQLSLEHESLERVGLLEEERYRRGFRRGLLQRAAAPLRDRLGRRQFDKLLKALSIVYGIEPYVVLKDIWGAGDREVEDIARWMLDALIDAALRDASCGVAVAVRGGVASTALETHRLRTRERATTAVKKGRVISSSA